MARLQNILWGEMYRHSQGAKSDCDYREGGKTKVQTTEIREMR